MLAAGKGWVLPVLAMLGPKPGLRVAARGSGPGAKRRRPCPPLRAVPSRACRDEGRPANQRPRALPRGRRTKGGWTGLGQQCAPGLVPTTCDTPPLSGDLICRRPLRFQSETKTGQLRDKAPTEPRHFAVADRRGEASGQFSPLPRRQKWVTEPSRSRQRPSRRTGEQTHRYRDQGRVARRCGAVWQRVPVLQPNPG